jgi:hypothetical protein
MKITLVYAYMHVSAHQQRLGKIFRILNICVASHLDSFQHQLVMQQTDLTTVVNCGKFKIFIHISYQDVESMNISGSITVNNNTLNVYDIR